LTARAAEEPAVAGDAAAQLYLQKCAGCPTVGGGKLTGPDLNQAATWPAPDLDPAIKRMEAKVGPLPDDQVATLRDLLKSSDVKERLKAEAERAAAAVAAKFDPPSADLGAQLFAGRKALANGGVACVACHSVDGTGGTLGPDLAGVYERLGETPLVSAVEKSNFKIMDAAYRDHAVTKQEALHLTKYFSTIAPGQPPARTSVPAAGLVAGIALAAVLGLMYRRRPSSLRRSLARRHSDVVD
jgi:mono/diheme cytochrome c family protein